MEDFLLRYPQKGESLFKGLAGDSYHVCIDPYISLSPLGDNWYKYILGYKDAADILVDKIIYDASIQEFLAFPTIFLYRHFVELSLKSIIRDGYKLYNIAADYRQIHFLDDLWKDCRAIIEKNWPLEYYEILDATENIIKELSKIDSTSFETRYPEKTIRKKKSENNKIKEIERDKIFTMEDIPDIDLQNMKKLMAKINNFLGDIDNAISIQLSENQDIELEYNSD